MEEEAERERGRAGERERESVWKSEQERVGEKASDEANVAVRLLPCMNSVAVL